MGRAEQKLFGITIFTWDSWDEIDGTSFQYYNVEFPFKSMKKFNGHDASLDMEGRLSITERSEECKEVWNGYVSDIPEFMEMLKEKRKAVEK